MDVTVSCSAGSHELCLGQPHFNGTWYCKCTCHDRDIFYLIKQDSDMTRIAADLIDNMASAMQRMVPVTTHENPHELDSGETIYDSLHPIKDVHARLEKNNVRYDTLRPILVRRPEVTRLERHWGLELDDTLEEWLYIDRNDVAHMMEVDLSLITLDGGSPLKAPLTAVESAAPAA